MFELTSDCKNCAALCCVALAFDKGEMFAFDKPAGVPCQHLQGSRCGIHSKLETEGLTGCVHYQCGGAGQRVVQAVFAGQSWQEDPSLLKPMLDAFATMRKVHELAGLLQSAKALNLPAEQLTALRALEAKLDAAQNWTPAALDAFAQSKLPSGVAGFLKGLSAHLARADIKS